MKKLFVILFCALYTGGTLKAQIPTLEELNEKLSNVNVQPFVGVWTATAEGKDYVLTLSAYERPFRETVFKGIKGSLEIKQGTETVKLYPNDEKNPFIGGWIDEDPKSLQIIAMDREERIHDYAEFKLDTIKAVAIWKLYSNKERMIGYTKSTLPTDMVFTRVK